MRLLLAEDEAAMSEALKDILIYHKYQVDTVDNGEDALAYAQVGEYDGIILDIMMPKMDGLQVLSVLRGRGSRTPVLLLTARGEVEERIRGLDAGADDYITKPFNIKEVILRINNLIKRSYDDPSKIKMDGYDIDLEKRRVFNGGEEVILTTKEYDLLVYFITNKGLAISREQVLNKVWDENYYGSDRVVDDTLRRLRKKMPEINVRTIYGFGYRLD